MEIPDTSSAVIGLIFWDLEIVNGLKSYFENIRSSVQTLSNGMKLTLRYLWEARESRTPIGIADENYFEQDTGIATLQYPYESIPVPDNGRYRLHNEIEDCIVCDKCAKICPVNCIDIEAIRAVEDIGEASDGSVKRLHAARFDIDMAKCCFCGLCTTVCPTECLTMTPTYDFSEYDVKDHTYAFAEMTPLEILEKKKALEAMEVEKAKQKKVEAHAKPAKSKPIMRPKAPASPSGSTDEASAKPTFRPKVKPKTVSSGESKPKPVFKPKIKPRPSDETKSADNAPEKAKPKFKPKVKPVIKPKPKNDGDD